MTSMTSGLLVPIGFEVSPQSVGAKSSSDTQDGRDEEVVKEGAHGPEGDKDCRVDVPRLKLFIQFCNRMMMTTDVLLIANLKKNTRILLFCFFVQVDCRN